MRSARLKLRLFLEGQEVPIISIVANGGADMAASASVQVIPTDDIHELKPCTLVHVFFFDLYPTNASLDALAQEQNDGGLAREIQTQLGKEYRLLFAGEFIRLAFARTASGRQAVLQCIDFSRYWDAARMYFHTGGTNTAAAKVAAFTGAAEARFSEDESMTPVQLLLNVLMSKPATVPTLDGLLGGAIRMLEVIGGIYRGRGEKFQGLNDYFAAAELRLRLSQMLGVSAQDTTSRNLFAHKEFKQWLRATLSRSRGTVSFRQLLDIVLGRIYHQYSSVLAPAYRGPTRATVEVPGVRRSVSRKSLPAEVQARVARYDKLLGDLEGEALTGAAMKEAADRAVATIAGRPDADYGAIRAVSDLPRVGTRDYTSAAGMDAAFFDGATDADKGGKTSQQLRDEATAVRDAYLHGQGGGRTATRKKDVQVLPRLVTHVFHPNLYFCAPPRCNVIFPDLYTSFSFQRSFLEEITRLELSTATEYTEDKETKKTKYYAPNIALASKTFSTVAAKGGARVLMPHEKFTGIVPKFEQFADITPYQKIDKAQGMRGKIPYPQRVANFNFFDKRFGARTASLTGHFNPYIVPGPVLVMDQYRADAVRQQLNIQPVQYLGVIQAFQHAVSQTDGSTQVSLTHVRRHTERLEYLGPFIHTFTDVVGSALRLKTFAVDIVDDIGADPDLIAEANDVMTTPERLDEIVALKGRTVKGVGTIGRVMSANLLEDALYGTITAEVRSTITRTRTMEAPLEKAVFPPWYAPIYTNLNIGRDFYNELYGVGSICDPVQFGTGASTDTGWPFLPTNLAASEANALADRALQELRSAAAPVMTADGRELAGPPSSMSASALAEAAGKLVEADVSLGATVEQAVDGVVKMYRELKEGGYGFDQLYRDYAWRPVATLEDIFGEPGFDISSAPDTVTGALSSILESAEPKAREGFHSRAFGPYDAMEKLGHPAVPQVGNKGEPLKVSPSVDPRGDRYRAVQAYVAVLSLSRGLRG